MNYKLSCINVGLPRTGTQSLDLFLKNNGFSTRHVGKTNQSFEAIEEYTKYGTGPIMNEINEIECLSDAPYFALVEALRKHSKHSKLIATKRSKKDWINSMTKFPSAGGKVLRSLGKNLEDIYDTHYKMISRYNIPVIDLRFSDAKKIEILEEVLGKKLNSDYPNRDKIFANRERFILNNEINNQIDDCFVGVGE